jgi:hypothetical protein
MAFGLGLTAEAFSPAEPVPEVYASRRGKFLVRVEPGETIKNGKHIRNAVAQTFVFNDKKKSYDPQNSFPLENEIFPGKLLITEDGSRIVAVDDWSNSKMEKPILVIYDRKGNALKRYRLKDFLTSAEIDEIKPQTNREFSIWQPWAKAVVLVSDSNSLRVIRDEVIQGPGKKYDSFVIDLMTFDVRKGF